MVVDVHLALPVDPRKYIIVYKCNVSIMMSILCPAVRLMSLYIELKVPNVETLIFLVPASNHFMF